VAEKGVSPGIYENPSATFSASSGISQPIVIFKEGANVGSSLIRTNTNNPPSSISQLGQANLNPPVFFLFGQS
jgi:hypothetical protein